MQRQRVDVNVILVILAVLNILICFSVWLIIMPCTVIVGAFWGDEGTGKIISYLAQR